MKNIIVVQGTFAPLNKHEVAQIKAIHKQYPDALIALNDSFSKPVFSRILKDFIANYAYLILNRTKRRPDITLEIELPFDLDNFYLFIDKKTLLADRQIMEELVGKKLSPKRFRHSISVANLAQSLARQYHYPEAKAYLAGLLHDVVKEENQAYLDDYLRYYDYSKLCEALPIKHSFCAKYYLKEHLNLYDDAILNAIYHHTDGKSNALLAKIIYIADKREPLRKIDDNILPMAYTNIHKAFRELKLRVSEYINNGK